MSDLRMEILNAYADCNEVSEVSEGKRNLDFRASETLSDNEWCEIMREACPDGYNEFDASEISEGLRTLHDLGENYTVTAAREGSVAAYFHAHTRQSAQALCKLARGGLFKADEIDRSDMTVRLWWD